MGLLQYLGVPEGDQGLLGDPRAYAAAQGIGGLTNMFGTLAAAFAPTTDPGQRGRMMGMLGPAMQQGMANVRQNAMTEYAGHKARQSMDRENAIQEAISGKPDDQLSDTGRQYRGMLGQLPENVRSALPLLSPEQRGEVLGRVLAARPQRQTHVVGPGAALVGDNGQPLYTAPFAPQRAPLPGPYDHLRTMPDGSIVDLRQVGGGGGGPAPQAPAMPAAPPNQPQLSPPNLGLPAPGRPSVMTPNQAPPDASPAGGAPMLAPQQGDVTTAQGGAAPGAPPAAALPPGTVRPPPPPDWEIVTEQNRQMLGLPTPREGAIWQRNRRTNETRQVGGSPITIDAGQRGENALATGLNTNAAALIKAAQESATTGVEAIRTANRVNQLLTDGAITGMGANWRLGFERAASAVGLIDGRRVANTQQLVAELARSVLPMVEQLKGPTSDRDLEFLRDAAGGKITLDQEALRRLTGIAANYGERAINRWNPMAELIQNDQSVPALSRQVYAPVQLPQPEAFPAQREAQPSPQAVVPGMNGGPAVPPDARPVLRYNPRTMRIE